MIQGFGWTQLEDYPSCDASGGNSAKSGYARQARHAQCSALLQAWLALLSEAKGPNRSHRGRVLYLGVLIRQEKTPLAGLIFWITIFGGIIIH